MAILLCWTYIYEEEEEEDEEEDETWWTRVLSVVFLHTNIMRKWNQQFNDRTDNIKTNNDEGELTTIILSRMNWSRKVSHPYMGMWEIQTDRTNPHAGTENTYCVHMLEYVIVHVACGNSPDDDDYEDDDDAWWKITKNWLVKVLCSVLITWEIHKNQIQQTPLLPHGIITDNDDWQYVSDDSDDSNEQQQNGVNGIRFYYHLTVNQHWLTTTNSNNSSNNKWSVQNSILLTTGVASFAPKAISKVIHHE